MLRGIDPILSPDLLRILREMGHGDDIVIADANFPGSGAVELVRLDGVDAVRTLRAVLSLMPLDTLARFRTASGILSCSSVWAFEGMARKTAPMPFS